MNLRQTPLSRPCHNLLADGLRGEIGIRLVGIQESPAEVWGIPEADQVTLNLLLEVLLLDLGPVPSLRVVGIGSL
jgi:hypothetical protein